MTSQNTNNQSGVPAGPLSATVALVISNHPGVGALNACSNQWGTSDLGATYGGFLAGCNGSTSCVQQKCQTIFGNKPDLLAGCNWFLGWFGAADNPNMVVKEIACPQMIKDRGLQ